jgi:sigma-B regulation protein RsbU (phosphoserine phosphatase)
MLKIFYYLNSLKPIPLIMVSFLLVLGISFLDFITSNEIDFFVYYSIPVIIITWYGGMKSGFLMAFLALLSWLADNYYGRAGETLHFISFWNLGIQLFFFLLLVILIYSIKYFVNEIEEAEKLKVRKERELAKKVQQKFFPQYNPEFQGIEYFGKSIPADSVGGDFYDYFKLNEDKISFLIGDIKGHGLASALLMAGTEGNIRSNALICGGNPSELVSKVNKFFCITSDSSDFASFLYSVIDIKTRQLKFVNAGHNPPLIFDTKNKKAVESSETDLLIGIMESANYKETTAVFNSGDIILLYTDGITEVMNAKNEQYGVERLKTLIIENYNLTAGEIFNKIIEDISRFSGTGNFDDDVTGVVIKIV